MDEVGRGALAGPVVVGVVSLEGIDQTLLQANLKRILRRPVADSKKLTKRQRERAAEYLHTAVPWDLGEAEAGEIDELGLTEAIRRAAGRAIEGLREQGCAVQAVQADAGLRHPFESSLPTEHIVRGDETVLEITLASILAKVYRDNLMRELAAQFPTYGWEQNAGYGSPAHLLALRKEGASPYHRQLFLRNMHLPH